jgi:hypothetical protein
MQIEDCRLTFVGEETNGSYLFANGLNEINGLNRLIGLAHQW